MKKNIYFDYAASTPIDPEVAKVMFESMKKQFGNSMSLHEFGQEASLVVEKARKTIADFINCEPSEIYFTSSATESNNLALKGIAFANKHKGRNIVISSIEHDCVLESAKWLGKQGFEITLLPVDKYGLISLKDLEKSIKKDTILVSVIHASNEIGIIQDVKTIGKICREKGVLFHTDASQSLGKIPIDVKKMKIDLLTASSHKIYGPKGVAFLYVKKGILIEPLLHGGGHEKGLRSSTVNVPSIAGFAKAVELCKKNMKEENKRLAILRDKLIKNVQKNIKGSYLNGHLKKRLSNNINISIPFVEGESLVMELDMKGVACSTGSACSSKNLQPSHVLMAIGLPPQGAHGSVRISLGRWTTEDDIDYLIKVLPEIVEKLRRISPFKK